MPDDDKIKISALPSALTLDNTDEMPVVQGGAGSKTTKKLTLSVLGSHLLEVMQFASHLQTQSKTIVGAINELFNGGGGGGSSTLSGLTDVSVDTQTLTNGQVLTYDGTTQKWKNAAGGGGSSWTDVTGTLNAGATQVVLQSAAILATSTVEIFTEDSEVDYNSYVVAAGSVTVNFDAQQSNLNVKARIS